jgi:mannose-6-phosphate isomerase-like protein (cupin superfamily)
MTDKTGKIWGTTARIHSTPFTETHLLEIRKGGFCSIHRHFRKSNLFFVLSGQIQVRIWKGEEPTPDGTELVAGQSTFVPPGVYHQFEAFEDSLVLEIYEASSISEDIDRMTIGGMRK